MQTCGALTWPLCLCSALCACGPLCPGSCCGIPCCFTLQGGIWAQFKRHPTFCQINRDKLIRVLLVVLQIALILVAFHIGRYFCFDGVGGCASGDPAAGGAGLLAGGADPAGGADGTGR